MTCGSSLCAVYQDSVFPLIALLVATYIFIYSIFSIFKINPAF